MLGVVISNIEFPNIHFSASRKRARWFLSVIALFALFTLGQESAQAQHTRPRRVTGMLTERLSANELRHWAAIERFVLAKDSSEQPLYPTLYELWNWIESGGHAVYIELPPAKSGRSCTAGSFSLEQFDPEGTRHVGVIRLFLSTIDQAVAGPAGARSDGFIPLVGLNKEERYAEVLGHELAHAVHILSDFERAQKVEEMVEQTNEIFLSSPRKQDHQISPWMRQRLIERDLLLEKLEAYAEKMEVVIWNELRRSSGAR